MRPQKPAKTRLKGTKKAPRARKSNAKQLKKLHNSMQDGDTRETEQQIAALESQWDALRIEPKKADVACEAIADDLQSSCAVQTDVLKLDAAVQCATVCVLDSLVERYISEDATLCARIEQLNAVVAQYQRLARTSDEHIKELKQNFQDAAQTIRRLQDENTGLKKSIAEKQAQLSQLGQRNERLIENIDRLNAMVYCSDIWGEMMVGEEQYIEESV